MARTASSRGTPRRLRALTAALVLVTAGPALAAPAISPTCLRSLQRSRSILSRLERNSGHAKFTPAKARELQDRIESYLVSIGTQLKNFDVDTFAKGELRGIPAVAALPPADLERLEETLRPHFEARRLPSAAALRKELREAGLGSLPSSRILESMDASFRKWRTKLVFDEMDGAANWNRLAKAFVQKLGIAEVSMEVGLLMKNYWEAFFESEKGKGIFNLSLPGLLSDRFTKVDSHEAVHMVVQSLASQGHESPYQVWIKLEKRYRKTGAIGSRQKENLLKAVDALDDGDFYRTELYADEIPAHIMEIALLNVQLSKELGARFAAWADTVATSPALRDELDDVYAEFLRDADGAIDWEGRSPKARSLFESFLERKASDRRSRLSRIVTDMTDLMNSVDMVEDPVSTAIHEARKVIEAEAARSGGNEIRPRRGGPIAIRKDVFLGEEGFFVEVKIPIDVLSSGEYRRVDQGAWVRFRFTNQGGATPVIDREKLRKLVSQTRWTASLARRIDRDLDRYVGMFGEGQPEKYSFREVFGLKRVSTKLRDVTRETTREIRDGR
jgi:hypothetical protein